MYKSCPKWLFWVYLDANKYFHSKSRPNFWCPQRKFARGQKFSFLRNDPRLPYFMNLMFEFNVETSKTCKMLLDFGLYWTFKYLCPMYVRKVANMSTFSILAQYVRMSLKEPLMYKSSRKWLCWVYVDTNKHFSPQKSTKFFRTPTKVFLGVKNYLFWEMTPAYPTWWVWYRKKLKLP